MHPRIEKAAFRKGEYVGYCQGAQRIIRGGEGWRTAGLRSSAGKTLSVTAPTLEALGDKLDKIAVAPSVPNWKAAFSAHGAASDEIAFHENRK